MGCETGRSQILYLSPEKLQSSGFAPQLRALNVSLIVVDEAHCISQWGYDFRPSYTRISVLREMHPDVPVLALTASATRRVTDDILTQLKFKDRRHVYTLSFNRPNISYIVRRTEDKPGMCMKILGSVAGTAIIYVRSRRRTREVAEMLQAEGINAEYYHAGLDVHAKEERQNRWKSGETRVIVATNAFGMGIDKPDVRVVIHLDIPPSLEEYYQEAGRAGRDGLHSFAVLLVSPSDKATLSRRLTEAFPEKEYIRRVYELAGNYLNIAVGDGEGHVFEFDTDRFCRIFKLSTIYVSNSLNILTRAGHITYSEEYESASRVMMLMNKHELYDLRITHETDRVLQALLRTYTGLFSDYVYVREAALAVSTHLSEQQIYDAMLALTRMHVLHYIPHRATPSITYNVRRCEPRYVSIPRSVYEERRNLMAERLDACRRFVFDDTRCRVETLLEYFGETASGPCGTCDVCRGRRTVAARHAAEIERRRIEADERS